MYANKTTRAMLYMTFIIVISVLSFWGPPYAIILSVMGLFVILKDIVMACKQKKYKIVILEALCVPFSVWLVVHLKQSFLQEVMIALGILRIVESLIISFVITILLFHTGRFVHKTWRQYRSEKPDADCLKYKNDFPADSPHRGNEFCRDCIHSVISVNNRNLICLNGKSSRFGTAVDPRNDEYSLCFERKKKSETL